MLGSLNDGTVCRTTGRKIVLDSQSPFIMEGGPSIAGMSNARAEGVSLLGNVERPNFPIRVAVGRKDALDLPDKKALLGTSHKISATPALNSSSDKRISHGAQQNSKGIEEGDDIQSSDYTSSGHNCNREMRDDNSVTNNSIDAIVSDTSGTSYISYACSSYNKPCCNSYESHDGGNTNVEKGAFSLQLLVDSCTSTTVSTPSPAASSTPRSARSGSLQIDGTCSLISACDSCDVCSGGRNNDDSGVTGEVAGLGESDTSLQKCFGGSSVAMGGCDCCPRDLLSKKQPESACCAPVCGLDNDEYKYLRDETLLQAADTSTPHTPTEQPTETGGHHDEGRYQVCATERDAHLRLKLPPVEELLMPATVARSGDVIVRELSQRHNSEIHSIFQSSCSCHPLENAVVYQSDASVSPAAAAGDGVWRCCSGNPSCSSNGCSSCSPSIFSQRPIVPLSAWPLPATCVCEDGALLPQSAMKGTSHEKGGCRACSRASGELVCSDSFEEDHELQEMLPRPIDFENRKNSLLLVAGETAQDHCRSRLRPRLRSQSFAHYVRAGVNGSPAELVLPALLRVPTHLSSSSIKTLSTAVAENAIADSVNVDDPDACGKVAISVASPHRNPSPVLFRSFAECSRLSPLAAALNVFALPVVASQGSSPTDATFCSSTPRTATLLLGDHDSDSEESTDAQELNACDSSSALALHQEQQPERMSLRVTYIIAGGEGNTVDSPATDGHDLVCRDSYSSSSSGQRGGDALSQSSVLHKKESLESSGREEATGTGESRAAMGSGRSRPSVDNEIMPLPLSTECPSEEDGRAQQLSSQPSEENTEQDSLQGHGRRDGFDWHVGGDQVPDHREQQSKHADKAQVVRAPRREEVAMTTEGQPEDLTENVKEGADCVTETHTRQLRGATAAQDMSAPVAPPTGTETCNVNWRLKVGYAASCEVKEVAAATLSGVHNIQPPQPQQERLFTRENHTPGGPALAQMAKTAGAVAETANNHKAPSTAIAGVPTLAAGATGPHSQPDSELHPAERVDEEQRVESLADAQVNYLADTHISNVSRLQNEALKRDPTTCTEQGRADKVREQTNLLRDCAVATDENECVPATPITSHHKQSKEGLCSSSHTRHRRDARSRRWSRSSSRGSVSSISTQSGLPSQWTSRSNSTRCSPLCKSRREPLVTAATTAEAVECSLTAPIHRLAAAQVVSSIPPCTLINQPESTQWQQVIEQASHSRVSVADESSDSFCSIATACDATASTSASQDLKRLPIITKGKPHASTGTAELEQILCLAQSPPTRTSTYHAAAAPTPAPAETAGQSSAVRLGPSTNTSNSTIDPAFLQSPLEPVDTATLPESHVYVERRQDMQRPCTLPGIGDASAAPTVLRAKSTLNSTSSPVDGASLEPRLLSTDTLRGATTCLKTTVATTAPPAVTSVVAEPNTSQFLDSAIQDPSTAPLPPCRVACTQQQSRAAGPCLFVTNATGEDSQKTSTPMRGEATGASWLISSSTSATAKPVDVSGITGVKSVFLFEPSGLQEVPYRPQWPGHALPEKPPEGIVRERSHVAGELTATSKLQLPGSCAKQQEPLTEVSRVQHQLRNTGPEKGQRIPLQEFHHKQQQQQHQETPEESARSKRSHHDAWCQQRLSLEPFAPGTESMVYQTPTSSNTQLSQATDYCLPPFDASLANNEPCCKEQGLPSSSIHNDTRSNHKSNTALQAVAGKEGRPNTAVDEPLFLSCDSTNNAGPVPCVSLWVPGTGDLVATFGLSDREKTSERNGTTINNGYSARLGTLLSGYQTPHASGGGMPQGPAEDVAARSPSSSALLPTALPRSSDDKVASQVWKPPLQHCIVGPQDCYTAEFSRPLSVPNAAMVADTAPQNRSPLPLERRHATRQQPPEEVYQPEMETTCSSFQSQMKTGNKGFFSDRSAQRLFGTSTNVEGDDSMAVQNRAGAVLTTQIHAQPAMQQSAARECTTLRAEARQELYQKAESSRQSGPHSGGVTSQQQRKDYSAGDACLVSNAVAAKEQPGCRRERSIGFSGVAANFSNGHGTGDDDKTLLSGVLRGCARGKDGSLSTVKCSKSIAAEAPLAAISSSSASFCGSLSGADSSAAVKADDGEDVTTSETKPADDAGVHRSETDTGKNGQEQPQREYLITMSDSRWIALRRSGLFRLGDKGRASIKSRIAKQLRLCPDLRRAAAAIGGGGVRCATTKQLYQLAELCGFDDVLPPEFRRPRGSTECLAAAAAATLTPGNSNTPARMTVTEKRRPDNTDTGGGSTTVPLSSRKRPATGEPSTDDRSTAPTDVTPAAGMPRHAECEDVKAGPYDNTSSCGGSFDPLSLRGASCAADAKTDNQNMFGQKAGGSAALMRPRQQKQNMHTLQLQPTAQCVSEEDTHIMLQQIHGGPAEVAPITQGVQHILTSWPPLTMQQQQQRQGPGDSYQHGLQRQSHQTAPEPRQLQDPQQQRSFNSDELQQHKIYDQQHHHHLVQQQRQLSSGSQVQGVQLSLVPPGRSEPVKHSRSVPGRYADEHKAPEQHNGQPCFPVPSHGRVSQQELTEPHYPLQQLKNLRDPGLQGAFQLRTCNDTEEQQMSSQAHQQTAQRTTEEGRSLVEHDHSNAAGLYSPQALQSHSMTTGEKTLQTSGDLSRSTKKCAATPDTLSYASAVVSTLRPALFSSPPAAGSTANNRYQTSATENSSCDNNVNTTSARPKQSAENTDIQKAPPRADSCKLSNYVSLSPHKQYNMHQQVWPRGHTDQPQHHDQQQQHFTEHQISPPTIATASGARVVLEGGLTSGSNGAAAPINSPTILVDYTVASGIPIAEPLAAVMATRSERNTERQLCTLRADPSAEIVSVATSKCDSTQEKNKLIYQHQPLLVLPQCTRRPSSSQQLQGESARHTTPTCGSCSTTSSRSCLAEDACALTTNEHEGTVSGTNVSNAARGAAAHSQSGERVAPVQVGASVTLATAAAAAATVIADTATEEKCGSSSAAREQLISRPEEQIQATQHQDISQAGRPEKKRRKGGAEDAAASQQLLSPRRAFSNDSKEQRLFSGPHCSSDRKCGAAQHEQQSSKVLQGLPAVPHTFQSGQVHEEETLTFRVQDTHGWQPQRQQLPFHCASQKKDAHQQYMQQGQGIQPLPLKDNSVRLPCCFSDEMSDGKFADATRYTLKTSERVKTPEWYGADDLQATYNQVHRPSDGSRPEIRYTVASNETPCGGAYCTPTSSWQEPFCTGSSSGTRCLTRQSYDHYSSSTDGGAQVSATPKHTHVVDELFSELPMSEEVEGSSAMNLEHGDHSHAAHQTIAVP